jgi:hypothetical protein
MVDKKADDDGLARIMTVAESLPDNERTRKIVAKREEERREREEKEAEDAKRIELQLKETRKK